MQTKAHTSGSRQSSFNRRDACAKWKTEERNGATNRTFSICLDERPETEVTDRTGHVGYTFSLFGEEVMPMAQ
jgi:hypothetical protein